LTADPNLASTDLPLDADRLWSDVMALAEITDPERPYTRSLALARPIWPVVQDTMPLS